MLFWIVIHFDNLDPKKLTLESMGGLFKIEGFEDKRQYAVWTDETKEVVLRHGFDKLHFTLSEQPSTQEIRFKGELMLSDQLASLWCAAPSAFSLVSEKTPFTKPADTLLVLSLSAGGVAGVGTGTVLTQLERLLHQPLYNVFDVIVGTSSGALLGLGASAATPGKDTSPYHSLVSQATENLVKISPIFDKKMIGYLTGPIGNNALYEKLVQQMALGLKMSDAKCVAGALSLNLLKSEAVLFNSRDHPDMPAWEAIRCSSALVPLFEPCVMSDGIYIDGGFVAENPTVFAYEFAKSLDIAKGKNKKIKILHVNATSTIFTKDELKDFHLWGGLKWLDFVGRGTGSFNMVATRKLEEMLVKTDPNLEIMDVRIHIGDGPNETIDNSPKNYGQCAQAGMNGFLYDVTDPSKPVASEMVSNVFTFLTTNTN